MWLVIRSTLGRWVASASVLAFALAALAIASAWVEGRPPSWARLPTHIAPAAAIFALALTLAAERRTSVDVALGALGHAPWGPALALWLAASAALAATPRAPEPPVAVFEAGRAVFDLTPPLEITWRDGAAHRGDAAPFVGLAAPTPAPAAPAPPVWPLAAIALGGLALWIQRRPKPPGPFAALAGAGVVWLVSEAAGALT